MEQSEEKGETLFFIPLLPGNGIRRGIMLSTALPGMLLILSAITLSASTIGALLLKVFSICIGIVMVFLAVKEYKKPGTNKWLGIDVISVMTGFLIIAQGAAAYQAQKEFQPAHLLFLAGFIYIFKAYMFPESKAKRGFTISDNEIIFRKSILGRDKKIQLGELNSIRMEGNVLTFHLKGEETIKINLNRYSNKDEIFERLKEIVQ